MAWCPYCRRYTVNGRCPSCNRQYDFSKSVVSSEKVPGSGPVEPFVSNKGFIKGFWLGIAINFGAIIIANKCNKSLLKGAITGMIINSVFTLHILTTIIYIILYNLQG